MTDNLFEQLYYSSFSSEEPETIITNVITTLNEMMGCRRTSVYLNSSEGLSFVASSDCHDCASKEGSRFPIKNRTGRKIGELLIVPALSDFTYNQEKMLRTIIYQLAGLLDRLMVKEADVFEEINRYKKLLTVDKLTGLYNRYHFEELITQLEDEKCFPVSVIVADIDGQKIINDLLGHKYGDLALIEAASMFKKTFRENDFIARIGGDEFVILLPFTQQKIAEARSRSLLEVLSSYNNSKNIPPLSFSLGIAEATCNNTLRDACHLADLKMYQHKQKKSLKSQHFLRMRCLDISRERISC